MSNMVSPKPQRNYVQGPGACDQGPGACDQGPAACDQGPGACDQGKGLKVVCTQENPLIGHMYTKVTLKPSICALVM